MWFAILYSIIGLVVGNITYRLTPWWNKDFISEFSVVVVLFWPLAIIFGICNYAIKLGSEE